MLASPASFGVALSRQAAEGYLAEAYRWRCALNACLKEIIMSMRYWALGLVLPALLAFAGCKHCHDSCCPSVVGSSPIGQPCPNCGGGPRPGPVVVPPAPAPAPAPGGSYYPPPFGASSAERKV